MPPQTEEQRKKAFEAAGLTPTQQLAVTKGVSESAITPAMLTQATPIPTTPPPTDDTNFQGIIAGGQSLADFIKSLQPQQTNLTDLYAEAFKTAGIEAKETKALESQKQLDILQAQMAGLTAEAQAVPIRLQQESEGRGITKAGLAPIESGQLRDIALRSLPLQGQILAQQAIATGDQRALQAATDRFDRFFNITLKQEELNYNFKKEQRDRIYDFLTTEEKRRIDALQKKDDRDFTLLQDSINFAQTIAQKAVESGQANVAAQITALDPKSASFREQLAKLAEKITPKKDTTFTPGSVEEFKYLYGRDPKSVEELNKFSASRSKAGRKPEEDTQIVRTEYFSQARKFVADNPNASYAELKAGILENTKLDISEIDSILAERGVKKEEREFSDEQAKQIVQAIFDSNKGFFSKRATEKANAKTQIQQGVIKIGGNTIQLTDRQIKAFVQILETL